MHFYLWSLRWWTHCMFNLFFSIGKGTFTVQADLQLGRQITRWIRRCGPVPSSEHLGEPLVGVANLLSPDLLLLPLDFGWSCPLLLVWSSTSSCSEQGPVVGTNFYLVPSCPYSIIPVFPVFGVHFFFSSTHNQFTTNFRQTVSEIVSVQWAVGKRLSLLKNNECVNSSFEL